MNRPNLSVLIISCVLLASCGAAGGDGAGPTDVAVPPSNVAVPAQRSVPGYAIGVERRSALTPGAACTVRLAVTPADGQAPITGIAVWLGGDAYAEPPSTTQATPVAGAGNVWEVSSQLPDPLPADATVWLRLTTADGSVLEIGRDAFRLADLPGG